MSKNTIHFIVLAVVLLLAQVVVFNHICLFGVAVPMVFIYLIIHMPLTTPVYRLLTVGFLLGLIVDVFSDTPGMNALACTVLAMSRRYVLRLYFNREDDMTDPVPSMRSLGAAVYVKYMVTMVFVYCSVIFLIEALTFFYPQTLLLRILSSTVFTSLLLLGIDSITLKRREKRL